MAIFVGVRTAYFVLRRGIRRGRGTAPQVNDSLIAM